MYASPAPFLLPDGIVCIRFRGTHGLLLGTSVGHVQSISAIIGDNERFDRCPAEDCNGFDVLVLLSQI